ncbi:MAG: hypothetical protein K2Q24_00225 [Chitinophagaceae bacterium]|nr:hypothetical protein [Chitinophagaceae bacterium]
MTILKGGVPYKDFFDHKPPLIFLILALGWPFKWWGVWMVGVLAKWIAALFLFKAAVNLKAGLSILVPLCFLVTLLDPFIICLGSFTREYTAVFIAIALAVILMNPGKKYIITGLIFGLTFFTQQEEILALIPFIIWHLCTHEDNQFQFNMKLFFQRILKMFLGFMIVLIPLLLWLFAKGALTAFWEQAFLYNFFIYRPSNPMSVRLLNALALLYHSRIGFFITGFLFVHFYFVVKKTNRTLHFTAIITFLLFVLVKSVYSRLGEMYNMQHYFMGFSALFAISALLILREWNLYLQTIKWKLAGSFVFLISSWFLWENALTSAFTEKKDVYYKRMQEILPVIQEVKNKNDQLFVFRNTAYIHLYNQLNCLAPTKWIYLPIYKSKYKIEKTENFVSEIIKALESNQTLYVVDMSVEYPLSDSLLRREWNKYLYTNYSAVKSAEGFVILKRNLPSKIK